MKNLISLLFIMFSLNVAAQTTKPEPAGDVAHIQKHLASYYQQRQQAYMMSILGGAALVVGSQMNTKVQPVFYGIGGIASLFGAVTFYQAERHLKRATFTASPEGISLVFKF